MIAPILTSEEYWKAFEVDEADLEFIYNHLLDLEIPQTSQELIAALIAERIRKEQEYYQKQQKSLGTMYLPKNRYQIGDTLIFPALNSQRGKVTQVRTANNPDLLPFEVIEVNLESGENRQFAASFEDHILNNPTLDATNNKHIQGDQILKEHGQELAARLTAVLDNNSDLVRIAGRWFPRALLVDVNIGHLNLAEALLDMEGGGPLSTRAILEQIELPTDVNSKLTEFSLNLALQEDGRFDEIGPAGEILWFLRRLEPEGVKETPIFLRYQPVEYDQSGIEDRLHSFRNQLADEFEPDDDTGELETDEITISLIYPHLRSGTLPVTGRIHSLFPTAYESPRVLFTFRDGDSGQKFSGWVVRSQKYVYGLDEWYKAQELIPGSLIHISRSSTPGEVIVKVEKRRANREWIRTVLIGADGGIVFALLKQLVSVTIDDRMAIVIPDLEALDAIWQQGKKQKPSLEQITISMMRELSKLNPQSQVHAQELYAAVNIVRRCPPSPLLSMLYKRPWATHIGDLYFRLEESLQEESPHE